MKRKALYVVGFVLLSALLGYLLLGRVGLAPAGIGLKAPLTFSAALQGRGGPRVKAVPEAESRGHIAPPETYATPPATYPPGAGGEAGIPASAYLGRSLIVKVEIGIEVPEGQVGQAAAAVQGIAVSKGGWVEYSVVTDERATVTVRIPVESLEAALAEIRRMGTVKSETRTATDVTDQLVDLDARLRNARAEEQRLLEILGEAKTVSEILQVEDRLSHVRELIERLEAQKKMLGELVDYATVTVEISTPEKPEPILPGFSLRDLARAALRALVLALTVVLVGAAFLAPLVLVGWAILAAYRRYKGGRGQAPQPGAPPAPSGGG